MTERLRQETRQLHEEVEKHTLAKHILDHSIDLETYRLLLWQNYVAYRVTENEVARFIAGYTPDKHLRLKEDLEQLDVVPRIPSEIPLFECHNKAEAFGAAYVIEGSALGGMLLAKNLEKCERLMNLGQQHFFNGDKTALKGWNSFKEQLNSESFSEAEAESAVEKAKETFHFFGEVLQLSSIEKRVL